MLMVSESGNLARQVWQIHMSAVCLRQAEWPHGNEVGTLVVELKYSKHMGHSNEDIFAQQARGLNGTLGFGNLGIWFAAHHSHTHTHLKYN